MDPVKLESYREGWRRRQAKAAEAEEERWQSSMASARAMADRLKSRWGATEVHLFGSVARRAHQRSQIRKDSDIDLAVAGVDPSLYFTIFSDIEKLSSVQADLVLMEDCSPGLRRVIQQDGISL